MTNSNKGFTLIELLVVVLIIGILAAVALPQYNKAVKKARVAEYKSNLSSIYKAAEAYFLAHPSALHAAVSDLDIDVPSCTPFNRGDTGSYDVYKTNDGVVYAMFSSNSLSDLQLVLYSGGFVCGGDKAETLCKEVGFNGAAPSIDFTQLSGAGYTE